MKSDELDKELTQFKANASKVLDKANSYINSRQQESCGKCVPCRIGTKRMAEIMERIKDGEGNPGDIEILERLGNYMKITSLCRVGLLTGRTILTMINSARDEFQFQINSNQM